MKFITIFFIATVLFGASMGIPCLNKLNKCFSKSSVLLISKPCLPSILAIKQFHFGTPCGRPPHLCTCGSNLQRPTNYQPQQQCSSCGGYDCDCNRQPVCTCGRNSPQLEEKDINIKLRILIPKCCSLHPY